MKTINISSMGSRKSSYGALSEVSKKSNDSPTKLSDRRVSLDQLMYLSNTLCMACLEIVTSIGHS